MEYLSTDFTHRVTALDNIQSQETKFQDPNTNGARSRALSFAYNTGATSEVTPSTDTADHLIALGVLPKNSKILEIYYDHEAMGTSATLDIGFYELDGTVVDATVIVDGDDVSAAGTNRIVPISRTADESHYVTTKEVVVVATAKQTADWADDKDLKGHVLYTSNS